MVKTNKDISSQNHIKLSILLLQNGLSFCIKNILDSNIEKEGFISNNEELIFSEKYETFDSINLAYVNNLNTFVPKSLFDINNMETYLKFNTKVLKNDSFCYDEITNFDIINVYVANNIDSKIEQNIEITNKSHFATTLVTKLLEQNKNIATLQFFVHFMNDNFQIIIIENSKLIFYNSFNFTTEIDVLYYILFVAEQHQLNPEDFSLVLLGIIKEESKEYEIIYKYIRNVSFYPEKFNVSNKNFIINQL